MNINPASSVWLARELKTSARKTVSTHKNALFQKSAPIRARRRDRVTPAGDKTYNRVQRRTTCESVRLVHAARHGDIINRLSPWQRIIYYIISCITSYLQKRSEIPTLEWKASEFWEKCRFCEIKCEMYKVKFWRRKKLLDSGTLLFCTYSIISHFIFSHSVSHVECSSGPGQFRYQRGPVLFGPDHSYTISCKCRQKSFRSPERLRGLVCFLEIHHAMFLPATPQHCETHSWSDPERSTWSDPERSTRFTFLLVIISLDWRRPAGRKPSTTSCDVTDLTAAGAFKDPPTSDIQEYLRKVAHVFLHLKSIFSHHNMVCSWCCWTWWCHSGLYE